MEKALLILLFLAAGSYLFARGKKTFQQFKNGSGCGSCGCVKDNED